MNHQSLHHKPLLPETGSYPYTIKEGHWDIYLIASTPHKGTLYDKSANLLVVQSCTFPILSTCIGH